MQIRSNIKNMDAEATFTVAEGSMPTRYIFVHGPNGSGKSAIVHSIEYALTGLVADAAGRNIKSKAHVNTLANGAEASVQVEFDGATHNGKKPRYNNVVADAMAAIQGSGTALVQYMLEHGQCLDATDTGVSLDYPSWDKWVATEGSVRKALLRIQKAASKALSKARAEVKDARTILKYGEMDGIRELLASALEAEAEVKELKKACDAAAVEWLRRAWVPISRHGLRFFFIGTEVRVGLTGHGPVPSGAEMVECAITLAALTRDLDSSVFILPDRAYDPVRLSHLLRVLRACPAALVVAQSPILPDESYNLHKFWEVVNAA